MKYFQPTKLNTSKRPELSSKEVILIQQANIGLYEGKTKIEGYQDGVLYLTTHCIIYVNNQDPMDHSAHIFHESIIHIDQQSGFLRSSPKLIIYLDPNIDTTNTASTLTNGSMISEDESLSSNMAKTLKIATDLGIWNCPICFNDNTFLTDKCELCGVIATQEYLKEQQQKQQSQQRNSTTNNNNTNTNTNTTTTTIPLPSVIEEGIHCPTCTYINHPSLKWCEMCETELNHHQTSIPPSLPKRPLQQQQHSKSDSMLMSLPSSSSTSSSSSSLFATTTTINATTKNNITTKKDHFIQLSFHKGGINPFLTQLNETLKEKAWETKSILLSLSSASSNRISKSTPTSPIETRKVGIQSIEQKIRDTASENRDTMTDAFQDLDRLMATATKMVKLAEQISTKMRETQQDKDLSTLRGYLINLGISNPVTRDTAGSIYHQELARELSEFLNKFLKKDEMKPLTDIYCIINRARGVALISPEDLFKACQQFEPLQLPYRIRSFEGSGLLAVQSIYMDDDESAQRILSHLKNQHGHITALELANIEDWALAVALEQLKIAEQKGILCRDDSPSGLVFYENIFV
ncbi:unnamed protein product [Cunninghamella echinulata]